MTITINAKFAATTLFDVEAYAATHTPQESLTWLYNLPDASTPSESDEVIVLIYALFEDPETYEPNQMEVHVTRSYDESLRSIISPDTGGEETTFSSFVIGSFTLDSLGRSLVALNMEHLYAVVGPITTLSVYNYSIDIVDQYNELEHFGGPFTGVLSFPDAPEPEGPTVVYGTNAGAAPLTWDKSGSLIFDAGVDKGVLYLSDRSGVSWNGLTSIQEQSSNGTNESQYFEGNKCLEIESTGDYSATLTAVTYPNEFLEYDGYKELAAGVLAANQESKEFHLSYRTLVGNELVGLNAGYKIHIVYNLTAVPSEIDYQTTSESIELSEFSWDLSTRPESAPGYQPTAHVIIDSRYVRSEILTLVEDTIYGSIDVEAYLPPLDELLAMLLDYNRLIITDHGDGTYTATGPDSYFSGITDDSFTLISDTAFPVRKITLGALIAEPITVVSTFPEIVGIVPSGVQIFFPYATPPGIWETNGGATLIPVTEYSGTTPITEGLVIFTLSQYPTVAIAIETLLAALDPDFETPVEYGPTVSIMQEGTEWSEWLPEQIKHGLSGVASNVFMANLAITANITDNFIVSSTPLD